MSDAGLEIVAVDVIDDAGAVYSSIEHAYRSTYGRIRIVVDYLAAAVLVCVLSPLILAIALAVRLDSPGPAFFRQERAGRHGRPFVIVKFRTLSVKAPQYSLKLAADDPHITRMGNALRRSGLDEIPQLWNVLRGEMALIGPRPEQLPLLELYQPWMRARMQVKPGMTGWWQIHHRDGAPLHLNIEKDLYYIENQSLWLDAQIVRSTLAIVLMGILSMARFAGAALRRRLSREAGPRG